MSRQLGRPVFAVGILLFGTLGLVYRDLMMWEPLPAGMPARTVCAILSALILLVSGAGILSTRFRARASQVLLAYLFLWGVVVKAFPVFTSPLVELTWLELGEITIVVVAAWLLTGRNMNRPVRTIAGLALIPIGLSHFFYLDITISLVPAWIPAHTFWAYLGGIGHLAAGLGLLFGVYPRLAAMMEAGMVMVFTVLVWIPKVISHPEVHFNWTEIAASVLIGGAAWVVADSLSSLPWLSVGRKS